MSKQEHNYIKFFLVVFSITAIASVLTYVHYSGLSRETIWLVWRVAMQLVFLYFIARHLAMVSKMLKQIQEDRLDRDALLAELKQTAEELATKTENLARERGEAIDSKLQSIDEKIDAKAGAIDKHIDIKGREIMDQKAGGRK